VGSPEQTERLRIEFNRAIRGMQIDFREKTGSVMETEFALNFLNRFEGMIDCRETE
jgi:hypothetical protein